MSHAPGMSFFLSGMKVTPPTLLLAIAVAGIVGVLSAVLPAYHAARLDIVEGLRYIGLTNDQRRTTID
jgi:ABC-type antimicrobial peptide transport system permease subunit